MKITKNTASLKRLGARLYSIIIKVERYVREKQYPLCIRSERTKMLSRHTESGTKD